MRIKHTYLLLLFLLLLRCNQENHSNGDVYYIGNLVVPNIHGRVNDYADVLTKNEDDDLNALLKDLEDSVGAQLVILTVDTLNGMTIEEYSLGVAEIWKIGRANYDDGILITIAMKDRKVRIEVGYGLELIIKDDIAKKIIDKIMVPEFQSGDIYTGLKNGSNEIIKYIFRNRELIGKRWKKQP